MSDVEGKGVGPYLINKVLIPFFKKTLGTKFKRGVAAGMFIVFVWVLKKKLDLKLGISGNRLQYFQQGAAPEKLNYVDTKFLTRLIQLLKMTMGRREIYVLILLTGALIGRTLLSIYLTSLNARIVKAMMQGKFTQFLKRILLLGVFALPGSFINSSLEYLTKKLALFFKERLSSILNEKLLDSMNYYKVTNLDHRIPNPDQRLTQDVEKWATSLSLLFNSLTKPAVDIFLFSRKLSELVGVEGPLLMIAWYVFSGILIKYISPPFGKLTEISQRLQGEYRTSHSDLISHSEEIAFYGGYSWEKSRIEESLQRMIRHDGSVIYQNLFMGTFDSLFVRYGATLIGFTIVALPIFGPESANYMKKIGGDYSAVARDFVKNTTLLVSLGKAIGKILMSYKEMQNLAGYTNLITEIIKVLEDLKKSRFYRKVVTRTQNNILEKAPVTGKKCGTYEIGETIRFEDVPIVTPNGKVLVKSISFEIKPGKNLLIMGPNGCGKSSLFRILGELWPLVDGKIVKPNSDKIFYIPQRPYLPFGTLRDQVLYPDTEEDMKRKRKTDDDIKDVLAKTQLTTIWEREAAGLDSFNDWNDILSGGEKQRIAMARLFYHAPTYAIVDECTSAVSVDVESLLYEYSRKLGITLVTISHRHTLYKYHDYLLKFHGKGKWEINPIEFEYRGEQASLEVA